MAETIWVLLLVFFTFVGMGRILSRTTALLIRHSWPVEVARMVKEPLPGELICPIRAHRLRSQHVREASYLHMSARNG